MSDSHPERAIITTTGKLADYVTLTDAEKEGIRQCRAIMPMKITKHYAALLERDNPDDPLIPFDQSGYVMLFEIDSEHSVSVLAVRQQRENDYY